jgi:hypothetical protein
VSKDPLDNRQDDLLADIKSRFGDLYQAPKENKRWSRIRDRLAFTAVILVLAILLFLMIDGSIVNFRCTFAEFITFECNRWAGEEHPSLRR